MQYIELKDALKGFTVFSVSDIKNIDGNFFHARLNEWQKKGYIKKIIKGYYIFGDIEVSEDVLFEIANRIYSPSYVSLEMGLSYYNLLPESVYGIISVSTRRTYNFETPIGNFSYRTIKPSLFWGYNLVNYNNKFFKIAAMEKAILDYFYIHTYIREKSDFVSLRIDKDSFLSRLNEEILFSFLDRFAQKSLNQRINSFLKFIRNA